MNEILKFERENFEKYNTSRINIDNGILDLKEHCKTLKIDKTKYGYKKAVVQLEQADLCSLIKLWETQINDYLKSEGIPPIKNLWGNKIYPKTIIHNTDKASTIKIKNVWINDENKPFLQLWLE